jgi:FkbM family methyltransferase
VSSPAITGPVPDLTSPPVPSLGNGWTSPISVDQVPQLLESMRAPALPDPDPDFYVDWKGIRTRVGMLPWAPPELAGRVSGALPIPDDGYRSEDVEYACLAATLAAATDTLRIVEVGAGWAPWSVAGVVLGRRLGLRARAIAVEADATRAGWAMQHAADNDVRAEHVTGSPEQIAERLDQGTDAELTVVEAAAWYETTTLQFPDLDEGDMGGAVWTLPGTDVDYRGAHLPHHDVPAVSLRALLADDVLTDLLHIDVQGVECDLLLPASDDVQSSVRLMAIGTTDRLSEGRLQQHFLSRGWGLPLDRPCTAVFTMTHPTLAGFTIQDGTQLWENPFVRSDFPG